MQNLSVCLFHELLPIFASLYAFMSIMLLDNISLLKSKKAWIVTEVGNSGVHMYFLNSFMTPFKNVTKYCQQLSWYQPPSRWVSSSFLGVYDLYSYRTLKVTAEQFEKTCEARRSWSLFIHPEQIYRNSSQATAGWGGKEKKKQLWWHCSLLWKAAMNSLHKPYPEEEDVGRPWDSFYMHQQLSALPMNTHHVSHYQIPVDLLPGN